MARYHSDCKKLSRDHRVFRQGVSDGVFNEAGKCVAICDDAETAERIAELLTIYEAQETE